MKKTTQIAITGTIALFALLAHTAYAVNPWDIRMMQRNQENTATLVKDISLTTASSSILIGVNGITSSPDGFLLGHGLTANASTTASSTFDVFGLTKVDVGLDNVDNTSDINKPIASTTSNGLMSISDKIKLNALSTSTAKRVITNRVQTDGSGSYTWSYASSSFSLAPVISAIVETTTTTIPYNIQIIGTPSSTSVTFKVLRNPTTSVLGIVVLGEPVGAQAFINLIAVEQ